MRNDKRTPKVIKQISFLVLMLLTSLVALAAAMLGIDAKELDFRTTNILTLSS